MIARLKITVCLGLLAGLLLSPKLWLSTRNFPLIPVLPILQPVPAPFDYLVFGAMLLLLVWIAVTMRPATPIAAFVALAAACALLDQQRWQPWFYQYLFMLIAISLNQQNACRLIIVSIYFWSGLQKINPGFAYETFPWMIQPFIRSMPPGLALAAPLTELAIAIGLLTRRFRNAAVFAAVAMHAFILACIGPLGHKSNSVVWPWNLAMGTLVVLLFRRTPDIGVRDLLRGKAFQRIVLLLFAILPALSFVDLWDSYLSFALYSGNQRKATIYMADSVAGKLPEAVQEVVGIYESEFEVDTLDIEDWSYAELNVPPYAEMRVLKSIGRSVCNEVGNAPQMVLMIEGRQQWWRRRKLQTYTCAVLQR